MSELKTLSVRKRDGLGKGANRKLRAETLVPGVLYNAEGLNVPIVMDMLPVVKMFEAVGRTTVFNIELDDNGTTSTYPVLFWQIQYHPVKNRFSHIDFRGVDLDKPVKIRVPLEFTGTSKGVKAGGKLEVYREALDLSSKPLLMPSKITIDLTDLEIGKTISVNDLPLGEGVSAVTDRNFAVVAVVSPKGEE